jgi:hypothetical protein
MVGNFWIGFIGRLTTPNIQPTGKYRQVGICIHCIIPSALHVIIVCFYTYMYDFFCYQLYIYI